MAQAGKFELKVSGPYPVWIEIVYDGQRLGSIRHTELSDLEYAVKKAMQEARAALKTPSGDDSGEV